jgi:hypothetical protein
VCELPPWLKQKFEVFDGRMHALLC